MKQFIVLMAVLPIMLFFMMQMGLDQKNSQITSVIQACVYAAKEEAKQEGCFTEEITRRLKGEISRLTGIAESDISIEADKNVKYRYDSGENRLIRYKVAVKIYDVMAANEMYGVPDDENSFEYVIDSYTASEKI